MIFVTLFGVVFFLFCCFCCVLELRFINVVYQSLTVCFLKGSDLGGFLYFAEISAERFKTQKTTLPPIPPRSPKTTKTTKKSAEDQMHAAHSGFLKVQVTLYLFRT